MLTFSNAMAHYQRTADITRTHGARHKYDVIAATLALTGHIGPHQVTYEAVASLVHTE